MSKIGLYAGSFDPITNGHIDIINRSVKLCDKLYVLLSNNVNKNYLFTINEREDILKEIFKDNPQIEVISSSTLTAWKCKELHVDFLIRGIRDYQDFEYEKNLYLYNQDLNPDLETIILLSDKDLAYISSSGVKEILKYNGDISKYVPKIVEQKIYDKLNTK